MVSGEGAARRVATATEALRAVEEATTDEEKAAALDKLAEFYVHTRVLVERPSRWSPAQQVAILELVERALYEGKNAALLCEQVGMPPAGLVRKWAAELAGWAERLEAAEDAYFDHLADETINIGDKAIADPDCLRKARQRQQSRQWLIERRRRRKYGRQVDLTTDGRALSPVALLPPELLLKESA